MFLIAILCEFINITDIMVRNFLEAFRFSSWTRITLRGILSAYRRDTRNNGKEEAAYSFLNV